MIFMQPVSHLRVSLKKWVLDGSLLKNPNSLSNNNCLNVARGSSTHCFGSEEAKGLLGIVFLASTAVLFMVVVLLDNLTREGRLFLKSSLDSVFFVDPRSENVDWTSSFQSVGTSFG